MHTVTSPYPTEKRNVVYALCGSRSSLARQTMQCMTASSSLSTPSVAASGATTVWANGPAAPPQNHFQSKTKTNKHMETENEHTHMRSLYA